MCRAANFLMELDTVTTASVPPSDNDEEATAQFSATLREFYGAEEAKEKVLVMDLDITADNFVRLGHPPGAKPIPYVYWTFGVTPREECDKVEKEGTLKELPFNHDSRFAPEIEPSLRARIGGWRSLPLCS